MPIATREWSRARVRHLPGDHCTQAPPPCPHCKGIPTLRATGGPEKPSHLLHLGEDNVHVGAGDAFAVGDFAVFAQLGPVLPIHFLSRSLGVAVDGEFAEALFQGRHLSAPGHGAAGHWGREACYCPGSGWLCRQGSLGSARRSTRAGGGGLARAEGLQRVPKGWRQPRTSPEANSWDASWGAEGAY